MCLHGLLTLPKSYVPLIAGIIEPLIFWSPTNKFEPVVANEPVLFSKLSILLSILCVNELKDEVDTNPVAWETIPIVAATELLTIETSKSVANVFVKDELQFSKISTLLSNDALLVK